jgi:AcrR family transcriptional regulator
MTRIRKDPQERTAEILLTAKSLFEMFGFQHVSMADLGQASSLARSSLYEYFSSKEEIALSLLSGLATPFEAIGIHGKKLEKRLTNLLEDTIRTATENSNLLTLYYDAYPGLDPAGRNQASVWQRAILNAFFEIFQDEKKLRFSASKAAYFSLGLVLQLVNDMVFSKSTLNPDEDAGLIAAFIVKGVD